MAEKRCSDCAELIPEKREPCKCGLWSDEHGPKAGEWWFPNDLLDEDGRCYIIGRNTKGRIFYEMKKDGEAIRSGIDLWNGYHPEPACNWWNWEKVERV